MKYLTGQQLLYSNPNLLNSPVPIEVYGVSGVKEYEVELCHDETLLDPQTGETFPKEAGEIMIAREDQLS